MVKEELKVCTRLKNIRRENKLTAKQLANELGVAKSSIDNYESGIRVPRDEIKVRYARFFNTSVERLFF